MRKLPVILLAIPVIILAKCAWVHQQHNFAAENLRRSLSDIELPKDAQILEESSDVGGFISGTGDEIDILAYRVFVSDLPDASVYQVFAPWTDRSHADDIRGIFRLDSMETPQSSVTEQFLRRAISQLNAHAYVIYSAKRIDDGVWDWRGW